ncbi:MAG: zinc-ribbon domain containing protein [Chloroflexi bacterium]|nr:zinc-ribbon domain containing protein [Chloroflexota bacterium]
MNYTDKWLICSSCGKQFLWDAGEQSWYQSNHLKHQPRHCKHCRDCRKKPTHQVMFNPSPVTMGR